MGKFQKIAVDPFKLKPHRLTRGIDGKPLIPGMSNDDFRRLVESVKAVGKLLVPIVIYEGGILEGEHRVKACKLARITNPPCWEFTGTDEEALEIMKGFNLARRHLSASDKYHIISMMTMEENRDKTEDVGTGSHISRTISEKADEAKISRRTAGDIEKVQREGTEEEKKALHTGTASPKALAHEIRQREKGKYDSDFCDEDGYPIPSGDASYYWGRRPEAEELLALVDKAKAFARKLDQNDVMWFNMDVNSVLAGLGDVATRIKTGAIPRHVCLRCNGKNPVKCDSCKGRGVIPKLVWEREPQEMRKTREHA
jgi:hypothetical protein